MLLKRVLENAGAEVEVAADGQMAMDVLSEKDDKNSSYDLFVLDMQCLISAVTTPPQQFAGLASPRQSLL